MSWTADSMDWGYESDETDPEDIIAAPDHTDYEEVESQASNEPELTIVDLDWCCAGDELPWEDSEESMGDSEDSSSTSGDSSGETLPYKG